MASGFLLVLKPSKLIPPNQIGLLVRNEFVDHKTVGTARRSVGEYSPTDERIGRDGESYSIRHRITDDCIMRKIPSLDRTHDACGS